MLLFFECSGFCTFMLSVLYPFLSGSQSAAWTLGSVFFVSVLAIRLIYPYLILLDFYISIFSFSLSSKSLSFSLYLHAWPRHVPESRAHRFEKLQKPARPRPETLSFRVAFSSRNPAFFLTSVLLVYDHLSYLLYNQYLSVPYYFRVDSKSPASAAIYSSAT
ncbi:hypothetical protein BDW72DRAFT_148807 [Aspergillus terricola var. indicus]